MTIKSKLTEFHKVGPATAKALANLGIHNIDDLLMHFPYRYLDFSKSVKISEARIDNVVTVSGYIKSITARRSFKSRLSLTEAIVSDDSGSIKVIWFNQPYLANTLKSGDKLVLSGKIEKYKTLQLSNPVFEKQTENQIHTGRLVPVYHTSSRVSNKLLRDLIFKALPLVDKLADPVPKSVNQQNDLLNLAETVKQLHFPDNSEMVKRARFKIAFNDLFPKQLAASYLKQLRAKQKSFSVTTDVELIKEFLQTLPFSLTSSQKRASWDILQDMDKATPMNRLLQGDVGSGKTLVALIAALESANAGLQTAILAPTEILARQHYETILKYLNDYPHNIGLMTRNFKLVNKEAVTKQQYAELLKSGKITVSIGTHAQLQDVFEFNQLGLIVIDEQHRFGVAQRQYLNLISKGRHPHLLSMSATPIPRTLALTILGDLSVSTLSQVPTGRKAIITKLVADDKRKDAYEFIRKQIDGGRQAFIITPRVEGDEKSNLKSAKLEYERLQREIFPEYKLGLVYGKMKGSQKDTVMSLFNNSEIDILVATSVIEIGIDVPNATVILIEGAERFGLAQLHQLRGRVGRGSFQSYCFLFTSELSHLDSERLQVFSKTNDGFALAELDLEQRGFGDIFGSQQTGYSFRFPEFVSIPALKLTKLAADNLLNLDPEMKKHSSLKKQVQALLEELHAE